MDDLDAETVLRVGGWDPRFTRVLVIAVHGHVAVALLDADTDLNLDDFERDAKGNWQAGAASGSVSCGPGMQGRVAYTLGQARPGTPVTVDYKGSEHTVVTSASGWWAFVATWDPESPDSLPMERTQSRIPVALRSKRWRRNVWRWPTATPPTVPPSAPPVFTDAKPAVAVGSWSDQSLAACLDRLRTSTLTSANEVTVQSAWTDGPSAFCVVYRNPYFDGLTGLRRDADDALSAITGRTWEPNMMTSGHDMGDRLVVKGEVPDATGFGWNVADFDIGEPHEPSSADPVDDAGVRWHGNLGNGVPARP